jgi:hypothetical protein
VESDRYFIYFVDKKRRDGLAKVLHFWDKEDKRIAYRIDYGQGLNTEVLADIELTPDKKWLFVLTNDTQLYVVNLNTFNKSLLYDLSKYGLFSSMAAHKDYIVLMRANRKAFIKKSYWDSLDLEFFSYIKTLQAMHEREEPTQWIEHNKRTRNAILFPELINMNHIYAYYNAEAAITHSMAEGCPLLVNSNFISPLSISL